jgi:hypothetical protein
MRTSWFDKLRSNLDSDESILSGAPLENRPHLGLFLIGALEGR